MAKYINYVEGTDSYFNFEFKEQAYPNAKYMYVLWDNGYNDYITTIEFDFKTNAGTIKCPKAGVNFAIHGKNNAGYFQIEGSTISDNNDYILINDAYEEWTYNYIKKFVLIEDNIGDETASTLAGVIKMLT